MDDYFYPLVFRPNRFRGETVLPNTDMGSAPAQDAAAVGSSGALAAHTASYREDSRSMTATLEWRVPWDLEPGQYSIEVGVGASERDTALFARSAAVNVVGGYADLVFCLCGATQHDAEDERSRAYVRCNRCRCWSHTVCVARCWSDKKRDQTALAASMASPFQPSGSGPMQPDGAMQGGGGSSQP